MEKIFTLKNFDWKVTLDTLHAYSAGHVIEVSDECAAYAVSKGYAQLADIAEDDLFDLSKQDAEARAAMQEFDDALVDDEPVKR